MDHTENQDSSQNVYKQLTQHGDQGQKTLYKDPKFFKLKDYVPTRQFTAARKELAAYAFLCRQQEAREWLEQLLGDKFPLNPEPKENDDALFKRSYKSDLYPVLRDGVKLCKTLNAVVPHTVHKINEASAEKKLGGFLQLENINFFLDNCRDKIKVPDHKLFLPLDLFERKNMPKVVYCIHEFARIAVERYGVKFAIEDKTGSYSFSEEELQKAQRDLEEIEQREKGKKAAEAQALLELENFRREEEERRLREEEEKRKQEEEETRKALEAEIALHNKTQVEKSTQIFHINQFVPADLVIEGWSKAEEVSGDPDPEYSLNAELTFHDGTTVTENVNFSTGSHDFEQKVIQVSTNNKLVKEVKLFPVFKTHTGKVWFENFGVYDNRPIFNHVHFVLNPSFEKLTENNSVAYWRKVGNGFEISGEHFGEGDRSILIKNEDDQTKNGAHTHAGIYQIEAAPVIIEAFSKSEEVSGNSDDGYAVSVDIKFNDGTKESTSIHFSTGTHDWEKKLVVFDPKGKPIKEVDVYVKFENHKGKVWFDHVDVKQDEYKQHVHNPSFESKGETTPASFWTPEGQGYKLNFQEYCIYGHTSLLLQNKSESEFSGAKQVVIIDQKNPAPIYIDGFYKTSDLSGDSDDNASVKALVKFADDSTKQLNFNFSTGNHEWENFKLKVDKEKSPVKEISLELSLKNHTGSVFIDNVTATEEYRFSESEVVTLQKILLTIPDEDTEFINEVSKLKEQILQELRKNHQLERELQKMEKKIALLIKNRVDIQEVLQSTKRFLRIFKIKQKRNKDISNDDAQVIKYIKKNANNYEHLFYLLQTEPSYLAKIVHLISQEAMENFLETVILTLFGDSFSPREEFLLLRLLRQALQDEIVQHKDIGNFIESNAVISKMIITYARRSEGQDYLVRTFQPVVKKFLDYKDLDLEVSPLRVYKALVTEREVVTGVKTDSQATTDTEALKDEMTKKTIEQRSARLVEICDAFLQAIVKSMQQLPFGLRWICRELVEVGKWHFSGLPKDSIYKMVGYFVYYRFLNPVIVSPDLYNVVPNLSLNNLQRKNLIQISKILQSIFNLQSTNQQSTLVINQAAKGINDYIIANIPSAKSFLENLMQVSEPTDHLMVDQYTEMTQGHKPVLQLTFDEVYSTHEIILKNLKNLTKGNKEDPLSLVIADFPDLPENDISPDDLDREIQLELKNKFAEQTESKELKEEKVALKTQTVKQVVEMLKLIPIDHGYSSLLEMLTHAKDYEERSPRLKEVNPKVQANLDALEKETGLTRDILVKNLIEEVSVYIKEQATLAIQRKNLITRLKNGLETLLKTQKFMNEQMESFNTYLQVARQQQLAKKSAKKEKKKDQGFKFTYKELSKQGILVDSSVPEKSRKHTSFVISRGEVGQFLVKAKVVGITADSVTVSLDDLLEKQSSGVTEVQLDTKNGYEVKLNVNLTIHIINKLFFQK